MHLFLVPILFPSPLIPSLLSWNSIISFLLFFHFFSFPAFYFVFSFVYAVALTTQPWLQCLFWFTFFKRSELLLNDGPIVLILHSVAVGTLQRLRDQMEKGAEVNQDYVPSLTPLNFFNSGSKNVFLKKQFSKIIHCFLKCGEKNQVIKAPKFIKLLLLTRQATLLCWNCG